MNILNYDYGHDDVHKQMKTREHEIRFTSEHKTFS